MNILKSIPVAYILSVALTAAIFVIDLVTPLGTAEWLGYILPLLVAALFLRRWYTIALTTVFSVLILFAFYLDFAKEPAGAIVNRLLGIAVIWVTAVLLLQRKRAEEEITELNTTLAFRAADLSAANQALETFNRTLEERVQEEVRQNREKDFLLIQQSRQAAMGEMINNIAHQWRQPLFALELFIQDLRACHESGQFTKEYLDAFLDKSLTAIGQMSQTIDDFMDFFKPDKVKRSFNPMDAIRMAFAHIEWGARYPVVSIECDDENNISAVGYPNEYTQALLNILYNARDALVELQVASPQVNIRIFREGGRTVVTVADNAGGIPAENIDKVFDPYFTTKEEGKGSGLGLHMAKMIIERNMDGKLTVRNLGDGVEFRIEV